MGDSRLTVVHQWFDQVWNRGDVSAIDRLMADDAVIHGLQDARGNPVGGKAAFIPFFHRFRDAFPDLHVEVEDAIADGDKIACRCVVRATHGGDSLGFAATHRSVEFTGMSWVRVRNGQIVEGWNNFDFAAMSAQLLPS